MRATSKGSFEVASRAWEPVLAGAGERGLELGEQLYGVTDLLSSSGPLLRALSDPSRDGADKAALAQRVLSGAVAPEIVDLIAGMARSRWSSAENLAHAVEVLAVDSILAGAQAAGRLETVEDEVFRISRLLVSQRELRMALSDLDASLAQRTDLVDGLFGGKVAPETLTFLRRSTATVASRSLSSALHAIVLRAAERRRRLVATVIAAAPLTTAQVDRLQGILERAYGRAVQVKVGLDESVIGGMRITVGSEVVDVTMLARLDEARRRLAG
jgi:F-type H+-transporting ATPase subunit delta